MRKRMLFYINKIELILKECNDKEELNKTLKDLLIQISFFQHERLVHLIVMALFAVMEVVLISFAVTYGNLLFVLAAAIMVLLIPYIRHYFFLENKTQYLYTLYDELIEKLSKNV